MDNNRLKEIADNLDKMKIGFDDTFKFNCTMCGKCCKNREDILLTPRDLFKLAKHLDIFIGDFVQKYCETYVGGSSRIPIVRLLPTGIDKRCPFLRGTRCSVNSVKPVVCALFPLGRCLTMDATKSTEFKTDDVVYINQNPGCGDNRKTHSVREWLETSNVPVKDEFFVKWHGAIAKVGTIVHEVEKKTDAERMNNFFNTFFMLMYLAYDFKEDFLTQFDRNLEFALELTRRLKEERDG